MAFNGSGTFSRLYNWVNDAAASVKIRADKMDAEMNGMATGLSTCITKDGQTTVTGNLPMSSYRHTGVGNASSRTDYAAAGQVQDGKLNWVDGGGTADAITAAYTPTITDLVDGQICFVRATAANATTTPTFSPDGLTARTIVKSGGSALVAGDIAGDDHELILRYKLASTRWELLNPAGAGFVTSTGTNTLTGTNTFTGKLITPDDGELTIATGAITVTGVFHTIDTEADDSTDNLDTISGGADGQILVLRIEDSARNVVLTTSGNIQTGCLLETVSDIVVLQYDGALSKWLLLSRPILDEDSMTSNSANQAPSQQSVKAYVDGLVVTAATQADQETATSTAVFSSPGRQQYHPSAAKFWAFVTVSAGTPTLQTSYNVTSITDTATGRLTVTIATDFSSANWGYFVTTESEQAGAARINCVYTGGVAAGSVQGYCEDLAGAASDPASWSIGGFGDQ